MSDVTTAVEVTVPELADASQKATLLRWITADGAVIDAGAPLAELETDKATVEVEADAAGILSHLEPEGATLTGGTPIGLIDGRHHPCSATVAPGAAEREPRASEARPVRRRISPLARRMAAEHGVDLDLVQGSGPNGRIVRRDVLAVAETAAPTDLSAAPVPRPTPDASVGARGQSRRVEPSRLQSAVARRMAEAKSTIPHFSVSVDVAMDEAVELRSRLKHEAERLGGSVPSYNDMVVKAAARALREHPLANAAYVDGGFELHERVNVGVAVAADEALVVPTVFDADRRSLSAIGEETRRLTALAREGKITAPELSGGTFTVSNLGMFGISRFTAIVNPPQAGILAVGALARAVVPTEEGPALGYRMPLTLSCDHRILYGAGAAEFLGRVRELLEAPWSGLS